MTPPTVDTYMCQFPRSSKLQQQWVGLFLPAKYNLTVIERFSPMSVKANADFYKIDGYV